MKAKIGYIEREPDEGCTPRFKHWLDVFDSEDNWVKIVYFEVEVDDD